MMDQDNSHLMNSNPPEYPSDEPKVRIMLLLINMELFIVIHFHCLTFLRNGKYAN